MNLRNYTQASNTKVEQWLIKSLKLSEYQKELLYNQELLRKAPFNFIENLRETPANILWRFSIIFVPIVYLILLIGLVPNYFVTGIWGYSIKFLHLYDKWFKKIL